MSTRARGGFLHRRARAIILYVDRIFLLLDKSWENSPFGGSIPGVVKSSSAFFYFEGR